jgi:hypothetical protein
MVEYGLFLNASPINNTEYNLTFQDNRNSQDQYSHLASAHMSGIMLSQLSPNYHKGIGHQFAGMEVNLPHLEGHSSIHQHFYSPQDYNMPWNSLPPEPTYPATHTFRKTHAFPRLASPISSFADGSISEDGSHTIAGPPTPPVIEDIEAASRYYVDMNTSATPEDTSYDSNDWDCASLMHCGNGISMPKIQRYPDSCHEDPVSDNTGEPLAEQITYIPTNEPSSEITLLKHSESRELPTSDDDADGESIDENEEEAEGEEEEEEEEEEDMGSDWSPGRSRKRSKTSRSPRSTRTAAATSNKKPSTRPYKQAKTSRITKTSKKNSFPSKFHALDSKKAACLECGHMAHSPLALQKHVATAHTRPFTCAFRTYGCTSTFGSKNEWKRHVSSQHLRLGFWRCQLGRCVPTSSTSDGSDCEVLVYNDFNRKDLFMQHVRRMHTSENASDKTAVKSDLDTISNKCYVPIRTNPPQSTCGFCAAEGKVEIFAGSGAWESRMEHVGRHLESGHSEGKDWQEDQILKQWLIAEQLIEGDDKNGWHLVGLNSDEKPRRR